MKSNYNMIQCNKCGYPVINGMHTCPNCLAEMPDEIVATVPIEEEVFDYNEDEIPFCTLRPIALPGEREMPEEVYEEGAEVYLSRPNTVPHDRSIDDEEQACFFFSDGHWFIEDRSRDNSTYVHAGAGHLHRPLPLRDRLHLHCSHGGGYRCHRGRHTPSPAKPVSISFQR